MATYNPLPFADIQDLHEELGGGMSLVDFAKTANRATGSNMFDSAVGNPFSIGIKRASSGLDRFLDEYAGPVNETLGEGGAWLFDAVGADPEFGRQVGEEALRSLVDYVPAIAGFVAAPFTGGASAYAGLAATAAMSGANAYEKTDSELMGLTSAALAGFGGKLTEFGATTALRGAAKIPALKAVGISGGAKQVVQQGDQVVEQLIAKQVGDRVLGAVAGESFVNVTGLLAEAGVGLVETGEWENPFTLNNMLAEALDPTLLFGVRELVQPSVISQKVIQHSDELKQFTNADTEEATRRMGDVVPDMVGNNAAEIERAYRDLRMQAEAIKDEDQKNAVLTKLEESRAQAREKTTELEPGAAQTLFGEALVTKLDEEQFTPKTVDTVDETGQVVKEEVTLEKILSPEELALYHENLSDILSPQSMIRLAELSEMDTPKTENEFRDSIVQMNAVRAELERGMVDDAWLQKQIAAKTDQGDSVEVAAEKAWQVAKNETEQMVEAKKQPREVREVVTPVEGEVIEPSAPVEKPSTTETDPDIVKAKEAVEDVEEEGWTPTDWSKLPAIREVPNSPQGIIGKLKAVEERKRKRPTGGRKNPVLDAPDVEEASTSAAFDKMVDDLIGADEIEYFSGLNQEQQSLLLDSREEALFESARVETRHELIRRTLAKDGSMSNKAIEASLPTFEKLLGMFDGDDIQLFEILDGSVRGAATTKGATRKLFLGDKGLEGLDDNGRVFAQAFVFAHELGHNSEQLYNQGLLSQRHWDSFDKFKRWTEESTPADRKLALELMRDGMVNKRHRDSDVVRLAMDAVDDPKEARANLMSMWAMGQLEKPDGVAMNLLPGPVRKGLEVLSDLYHSVVSAFRGVSSFDLMFKNRQATRAQLDQMSNMMKTWKKELNKSQDFYTEAQGLLTVGPAAYRDTLAFFGKKDEIDRTSVLPHDTRGLLTKAFDEWIMPFDQLTQMVPQFKGIAADLHNYTGDVRAALNRIAGMVAGEVTSDGKVSFANRTVKMEWKQVRDDQKLNKLASNWMRAQQEAPGLVVGKGRKLSFEDLKEFSPDTHKQLVALPEKQRKAVINVVTRMGKAMEKLQSEVLNVVNASNESMVMSYIANKMPEIRKDAPGLAQLLNRGVRDIKSTDPAVAQGGQLMLSQVATKLGHEQFYKAYDIATKAADSFEKLNVELKSSPHFFSEMRFGKHFLHWTRPDGTSGGLAFDSLKAARAKERQLKDSGASVTREETSRGAARLVGRDQLLDRLEEFDERGKALVDVLDLDDETKRILKTEFNSRWEFLRDVNAAKVVEPGSKRHLAEGREDLDMIQTQMMYFQVAMRTLNKKLLNHRLNYRFSDPELNDPQVMALRPQLESMIKNFFTPDTELGRGISTFNAGYFLGGNLSSHLIELMQPGFSFVPELINRNVGFLEAQKMTLKAMSEVGMFTAKNIPSAFGRLVKRRLPEGRNASQTLLEGRDDNTLWANAEYGAVMEYAASRGKINLGHASDVMDVDIENNTDITGMLGKGRSDEHPFKKYGITPAMELVRSPLKFYQQFTEFNARVSLILGYELAKKRPGVSKQRAIEEAFEFSNTVTFSGGKLNRPNQLFTGEGTYRTAGQALYSLQGYTFGMLGMMRRYAETGYSSKQFPGLTSEQRKAARKSLKTILATQFLGAGALGMPFVGAAMLLMENLTGVEFEREMREGLAELFKEDEEDEGLLSDAVMHGAANAILGSMLPGDPDLGSRFDIGGVMGINSYNGFSLDQMFGTTGSVIQNVVNGSTEIAQGNTFQGLIDMAPVALKRVLETVKNEGELRDRNGALLIDATFGEKISNAVGFAPQAVKKMRNNERLQARHEEKVRTDMIRKFDDLAEMYMENPTGLKEAVRDIADNDPKVQLAREMGDRERAKVEFIASQRAAAAKIAERLQKKIFPKDSGRSGTLRGTYGESTGTGQVTEVARMQLKAQVEQNLGLRPSLTQRSMQRAAIIDRLMQQNPGLGRPEAAARADQLLARL